MKKNKFKAFAIIVDDAGVEKLYLKKLIRFMEEHYSYLKQERSFTRYRNIKSARTGDVILFGTSSEYDYTTISGELFEKFYDNLPAYSLRLEYAYVKQSLESYILANFTTRCDSLTDTFNLLLVEEDYTPEVYVVSNRKKTKKNVKPVVKVTTQKPLRLDEIRVFHNYVQIGWDNFDIYVDESSDREFIVADGNVYFVERDFNGKGRLTI